MRNKQGCNMHGFVSVNRVAGNLHFFPGRSFQTFFSAARSAAQGKDANAPKDTPPTDHPEKKDDKVNISF